MKYSIIIIFILISCSWQNSYNKYVPIRNINIEFQKYVDNNIINDVESKVQKDDIENQRNILIPSLERGSKNMNDFFLIEYYFFAKSENGYRDSLTYDYQLIVFFDSVENECFIRANDKMYEITNLNNSDVLVFFDKIPDSNSFSDSVISLRDQVVSYLIVSTRIKDEINSFSVVNPGITLTDIQIYQKSITEFDRKMISFFKDFRLFCVLKTLKGSPF